VLNFIAIDLQLYKIFKITRVSFLDTVYIADTWPFDWAHRRRPSMILSGHFSAYWLHAD